MSSRTSSDRGASLCLLAPMSLLEDCGRHGEAALLTRAFPVYGAESKGALLSTTLEQHTLTAAHELFSLPILVTRRLG